MATTLANPDSAAGGSNLRATLRQLRRLAGRVPRLRRRIGVILSLLLGSTLLRLPVPFLTIYIIDVVIAERHFDRLLLVSGLIVAMSVAFILVEFTVSFSILILSQKMIVVLQKQMLEHVERLPISYFNKHDTGYMMSRFSTDLSIVSKFLSENVVRYLEQSLLLLVGLGAVLYINWKLALASAAILPFYVIANLVYADRLRNQNREVQERSARATAALYDLLEGILAIKVFTRQKLALRNVLRRMKERIRAEIDTFVSTSYASMAISFLSSLAPLIVLLYGGYQIMQEQMTLGELVGFSAVLGYLMGPARTLTIMAISAQRSFAALDRVVEVLDTPPEPGHRGSPGARALRPLCGHVAFEGVTFGYRPDVPVLRELSFAVPAESSLAIVGGSGAGKSTLVNLLLRLYHPLEGRILVDGVDVSTLDLDYLRRNIGLVSQETFLFNTSILENIRFGLGGASRARVVEAARLAYAHEFIERLPDGYETVVGRLGFSLSAGQRQRIALARAFLKEPRILVLDEATSSVDSRSEDLIWQAMGEFASGRTTLVISHRLSALSAVDRIVQIDNGAVIAAGRSGEVMADERFRSLFRNQRLAGEDGAEPIGTLQEVVQ
jgi:ATP-binding cassette, subfamily B, bacterial MsbA